MAAGKGNTFINSLLKLIFQNISTGAACPIGDASGLLAAGTTGSFYLSLHTADPGAAGAQNTSEAAYTSYARVAVARSAAGFTVTGQTVTLFAAANFPAGTGGGETCTYIGIGTSSSGAGVLLYKAPLSANLVTGSGITPQIATTNGLTEA